MSMDEGTFEVPDATEEIDPTEQGGQVEEAVTPDDSDLFNLDEVGEKFVTVGDERVKVADLRNGYLRQADYTRKTQEIAQQRKEAEFGVTLQKLYEQDPALAIQFLTRGQTQVQAPAEPPLPEDPHLRALEEQRRYFESQLRPIQESHAEQELTRIVGSLAKQYEGAEIPFDPRAVVQRAVELGHEDPYHLEDVYKQMVFDEYWGRQLAEREFNSQSAADDAARQAAAAGITSHSNGTAAPMTPPVSQPKSMREAFADAYAKAGGDPNDFR